MKTGHNIRLAVVIGAALVVAGHAWAAGPGWGSGRGPGGPAYMGPRGPFAGPMASRPGSGPDGLFGVILHRLDLTAEQRDEIREIATKTRTEAEAARDAVAEANRALQDAVAEGATKEQIAASAEKLAQAITQEAVLRAEAHASIKEILTEEQVAELEQMKARAGQFRERMRDPENRRSMRGRRGEFWGSRPQRGPWMQPGGRPGPAWQSDDRGPAGRRGRNAARRPQGFRSMPLERRFERADANDDGQLTMDEARPLRERPGRFDRRDRGVGSQDAFRGGPPARWQESPGREPQMRSGRGRASNEQPGAGQRGPASQGRRAERGPASLKRIFAEADANEDGLLSMEEVEKFQNERRGNPPVQPR